MSSCADKGENFKGTHEKTFSLQTGALFTSKVKKNLHLKLEIRNFSRNLVK